MYLGNRNPWTDRYKILHVGCLPWYNHACQFWWRSDEGFWRGEWSNFGLFHWLTSSPLKHYRTIARVCDWHKVWVTCLSHGRNQLCKVLSSSVKGFGFCEGSKFDRSHWIAMSPLTLLELTFRCDFTHAVIDVTYYATPRIFNTNWMKW